MSEEIKLKRCPFCGCEANLVVFADDTWEVQCSDKWCRCHTAAESGKNQAILRWNKRQEQTKAVARVEVGEEKLRAAVYEAAKRAVAPYIDLLKRNAGAMEIETVCAEDMKPTRAHELDDWKGNAEGFQPDAYMKLPVDADGVSIRLKDWVWYVGIDAEITKDDPQQVVGFVSDLGMNGIYAVTRDYPDKAISPKMLTHRAPEPADSWEKLEKDAMGRACELSGSGHLRCGDCEWGKEDIGCQAMARLEILKRAKKLAGIEGEAE